MILKLLGKASPYISICLLIYLGITFMTTWKSIEYVTGSGSLPVPESYSQILKEIKKHQDDLYKARASVNYLSQDVVDNGIQSIKEAKVLSSKKVAFKSGKWVDSPESSDGKEYLLKTGSIVETLIALDKLKFYYDYLKVDDSAGEILVRVRLVEI